MVIRELLVRLGLTGGEATGRALDNVDSKIKNVQESFRALGGILGGVLAGLSIKSVMDIADEMQSLEARLNNLPQTMNNGAAAFDTVAQHASAARMSVSAYAKFLLRVGNATQDVVHSQDELLGIADTVSKALVVGGASAEEQSSALLQLSQALGSGVLQGDEFRSMAESAPQLLDAIGKALGYPRDQLKKFASEGKLTTQAIIQALKKIGPQFDQQFKKMPLTFGQAMTIISNRWGAFVQRLNRSSGAITWLSGKFLWLADKAEHAFDVVVDALGGAEKAVMLLASALGGLGIVASIYAIKAAFAALASPLGLVALAAAALYLAFDDFRVWTKGGDSVLGDLLGDYEQYRPAIEKITSGLNAFKDIVGGWQTIFEAFAVYLGSRWLMSVLKTLGIVSKAAAGTGAGIAAAGGLRGFIGKAGIWGAAAVALYDPVESVMNKYIGNTSFGKWAKNTTLGDAWNGMQRFDASIDNWKNSLWKKETPAGGSMAFSPTVNLTVNSPNGTPEDIKKAVDDALSGQIPQIQNNFSSDLLFNRGVTR